VNKGFRDNRTGQEILRIKNLSKLSDVINSLTKMAKDVGATEGAVGKRAQNFLSAGNSDKATTESPV